MDIDDFMNLNKVIKPRVIQASANNAYVPTQSRDISIMPKREKIGPEYFKSLREEQDRKMERNFTLKVDKRLHDGAGSSQNVSGIKLEGMRELYLRYDFDKRPFNPHLPIHIHRDQIINRIRNNPVLIIKGETGCGKSTQVPQFILDDAYKRKEYCNIVVTQPRRIAASSLATQVALERNCEVNSIVGYQIGLERFVSEDTRIIYCTTGVLLQKLVQAKHMTTYTHIILDEVHERDEEMEFLLIVIKNFLIQNPNSTKIILMSGTINTEEFSKYFRIPRPRLGGWADAPSMDLDSSREFEIHTRYLEDLDHLRKEYLEIDYDNPGISKSMYKLAVDLIFLYTLPERNSRGYCILIFLPGLHEIKQMYRILENEKHRRTSSNVRSEILILPLHSSISSEEQRNVFIKAPPNVIKIILATNIAESSITVPDVKYVIDFALTRILTTDSSTGYSTLRLKWASKSSCKQREGRTGRTTEGHCFRLIHRQYFEDRLRQNEIPALKRCALEKIVLKAKIVDPDSSPKKIIGLAMDPPDMSEIMCTVMNLKSARGLHLTVNDKYVEDDGDLTIVGRIMEALPLDIKASRLIIFGYIFNVLEECIIIAAGTSVQKVFALDIKDPIQLYTQKLIFADGSGSDLIAILHAYQYWLGKIYDNHYFSDDNCDQAADRYNLDIKGLYEMHYLIGEIKRRLEHFKLFNTEGNHARLTVREKNIVLKVCIAGAFYPNYFTLSSLEDKERDIYSKIDGRDPCNTVFFRGFKSRQLGSLYQNQVKEYFRIHKVVTSPDDVKVTFDHKSEAVFATFLGKQELIDSGYDEKKPVSDWMPGKVMTQVYKAVKLNKARERLTLNIMNDRDMMNYAEELNLGRYEHGVFLPKNVNIKHPELCILPGIFIEKLIGRVSCIITPNKFWFKPTERRNEEILDSIRNVMNTRHLNSITELSELKGKIVAARVRNEEDRMENRGKSFHRAKILSEVSHGTPHYQILLIDEGDEAVVRFEDLRSLDNVWLLGTNVGFRDTNKIYLVDIPPRAFECTLAEIQPSYVHSSAGKWTPDAIEEFKSMLSEVPEVIAEIYSVWNSIVSVVILDKPEGRSIGKILIEKQYAQSCEENYLSKANHAKRFRMQNFEKPETPDVNNDIKNITQDFMDYLKDFYEKPIKPAPKNKCNQKLRLEGPFSQLEVTPHACTRAAIIPLAKVDQASVNSVLLAADPQDPGERIIVAATIGKSPNGSENELILRNTTLMPNIHGFPVIMAMLFSPVIELHRDKSKTRYNAVLCGLGYDKTTKESYYPEQDLALHFDTYVDQEELTKINRLRYYMSSLLNMSPNETLPNIESSEILKNKMDAVKELVRLMQKPRRYVDVRREFDSEYEWGQTETEELLKVEPTRKKIDRPIFPYFTFMKLYPETDQDIQDFRNNNQDLHAIAFCNAPISSTQRIDCLLCHKTFDKVANVCIHLFSKLHQDRAKQCHARFQIEQFKPQTSRRYFKSDYDIKRFKH